MRPWARRLARPSRAGRRQPRGCGRCSTATSTSRRCWPLPPAGSWVPSTASSAPEASYRFAMNPAGSSLLVRDLIEDDVVDITPQALMERLEATAVAFSKVADEIGRLMILLEGHE